ncbi:MAG: hypothetical protein JSV04_03770 [Candidatus Heimdallarchaeota archaeon]|nr:MAG: hypothetical protein JSV04_03770 [Candidatus Heimdallarchaeota archaeon]
MSTRNLVRRILGPYRISHHPLCDHYKDHVYRFRGNKICRGCVMQYSGMIFSFFIITIGTFFQWWKGLTEIQVGLVLYAMILPTLLTAFLIENRIIKDVARFLLGASFSLAFIQFVFTPDWLIKLWILINLIPGYIYLNKRRAKKNDEVCNQCEERINIPLCSGYQIFADREKIFMAQAVKGGIHDPFALSPDQLEE